MGTVRVHGRTPFGSAETLEISVLQPSRILRSVHGTAPVVTVAYGRTFQPRQEPQYLHLGPGNHRTAFPG